MHDFKDALTFKARYNALCSSLAEATLCLGLRNHTALSYIHTTKYAIHMEKFGNSCKSKHMLHMYDGVSFKLVCHGWSLLLISFTRTDKQMMSTIVPNNENMSIATTIEQAMSQCSCATKHCCCCMLQMIECCATSAESTSIACELVMPALFRMPRAVPIRPTMHQWMHGHHSTTVNVMMQQYASACRGDGTSAQE